MSNGSICVDWCAGAGAQLEVFSPRPSTATSDYSLKYTPPFRSTIRPPIQELSLGAGELIPINRNLDTIVQTARGKTTPAPVAAVGHEGSVKVVGGQLFSLIVPSYVELDLREPNLFLEIGVDEALLQYPWELLHDGDNFLCLKHYVGRFVNSNSAQVAPNTRNPLATLKGAVEKVSVLLISVPSPLNRDTSRDANLPPEYKPLDGAREETIEIGNLLAGISCVEVTPLKGPEATYDNVFQALKEKSYHIIHYNGHAYFDDQNPKMSSLVLFDQDMTTGHISKLVGKNPPVLCFVNACETAMVGKQEAKPNWNNQYNILGLAQSFLSTGAYLLGSRWRLSDPDARKFATGFYTSLLKELNPLGRAVLEARNACKAAAPDSFAWASYVFYGDPRVYFRKLSQ
jgi:CHAT domain-containing protein